MSTLARDLRRAARQLWRQPLFTLTAVLTLAIGMGVNTVAFTVVNGLLFKKTSGGVGDDVGRISTTPGGDESGYASLPEYQRFEEGTKGTLEIAAEGRQTLAWRHDGQTEPAWVLFVSSAYFSIVKAPALTGRVAVSRAASGAPSVVIGERFWRRKLNAAPLGGLTLRLNDTDVSVAGVVAESFHGPAGLYSPDVWLPLEDLALFRTSPALQKRDIRWLFVFGRLRPGVQAGAVQGQVDAAAAAMAREWPESHRRRGARFALFAEGNAELRGIATGAAIGMGIIGLVLLLACFNTSNLLLARAMEREREIAIHAAIGAAPLRLMRLVVLEGLLIAALAGAAALVIARWTQSLVGSFAIPIETPQHIDLAPDVTVVGFVLGLVIVAALLPGLWPAMTAARVDVLAALGSHNSTMPPRRSRMGNALVAAQIAGSTAFLAIAALLTQSYSAMSAADMGFAQDELLVAELDPASHGYGPERAEQLVAALAERVRALPAVANVAVADRVPFFIGFERLTPVSRMDSTCDPETCLKVATIAVGPGYFRTMGIGIVAGREFERTGDSVEVIVNQPLGRLLWPDDQALGEALRLVDPGKTVTVVGIAAKTHTRGSDREAPRLFVPLEPRYFAGAVSVVARTQGSPATVIHPFVEAASGLDQSVALLSIKTMRERMAVQLWPFRTVSSLFAICGALALFLSTTGLAGVVMHAVTRRFREFGVRMAVGATRRDLMVDVLRGSTRLLVPGLAAGVVIAALAARLMQVAFYGVNVLNPLTYIAVVLLECAIVGVASIGPALRAARVDPLKVLRAG